MKLKLSLILLLAFTACTLEPNYKRPKPGLEFAQEKIAAKEKITNVQWERFFKSADLQRVIKLALNNNKDLQAALHNIDAAQANYGVVRSNLLPTINAVGSETRQGAPKSFAAFTPKRQFRAGISLLSFELDFFGRIRSLKKAALEQFLSTQEAEDTVRLTLITAVANGYAQLVLDNEVLALVENSLKAQQRKAEIMQVRYENGINRHTDYLAMLATLETTKSNWETQKKIVEQDKNNLMLLCGIFDERVLPQISSLKEIEIDEDLLSYTPSEVLLERPDVMQAEHDLKSANANIGAARAAFFPAITLTGNYGYASRDWVSLFDNKSWTYTPQISLPIFSGGKNWSNLKYYNAQKQAKIAQYQKVIQNAFTEAKNELAQRQAIVEQLKSADEILKFKKEANRISKGSKDSGIISVYDYLDSEITFYSAQETALSVKKEYLANLITLYKVFGGGKSITN